MKEIYWIQHDVPPRVAIVARPRGGEWLQNDLQNLKRGGIDVLVSLLMPEESAELGLNSEQKTAEDLGMNFVAYPIPDRTVPTDLPAFSKLVARLTSAVRDGSSIAAHCRASIGRSTVVTAAILISQGISPDDALALIEEARGYPVPDTIEQREWIRSLRLMS
jgi:protein-tyrosine phosphatase